MVSNTAPFRVSHEVIKFLNFLDLFLSEGWPNSFPTHMGFLHVMREAGSGSSKFTSCQPYVSKAGNSCPHCQSQKCLVKCSGCPEASYSLPFRWAVHIQDSLHSFTRTMDLERGGPFKKEMRNKHHKAFASYHIPFSFLLTLSTGVLQRPISIWWYKSAKKPCRGKDD